MNFNFTTQQLVRIIFKAITAKLLATGILASITLIAFSQPGVHDPSGMVKNKDGRYWIFSTGNGVSAMSAEDTSWNNWRYETAVFPNGFPSWITTYTPDFEGNFWAPDVIYMNGYYYVYYSTSSWGTTKSSIGVARTEELGTAWTDLGAVVSSSGNAAERNAIDPGLFKDDDGSVWMTYGSFFGGIGVVEIDTVTGKTIGSITTVAGGGHQDIEAPYLAKHGDYYYLFVNRGKCCDGLNSTYYITVGRSTNITGPYSGWRTFLDDEDRYHGPGHVGLGEGVFTYHFYDTQSNGTSRLSISSLTWTDGWPVAGTPYDWSSIRADIPEDNYRIIAEHSGMAIEVANNNAVEGADVRQTAIASENGQIWKLTDVGYDWYQVAPIDNTNLGFDVYGISSDDGANIVVWSYWGGDGQQYMFKPVSDNLYQIIARNSNKCLQIKNASLADGATLIQNSCDEMDTSQLFSLESTVGNPTSISNTNTNAMEIFPNPASHYISVKTAGTTNDLSLTIYDLTGRSVAHYHSVHNLKNQIDISDLQSGKYIVKVTTGTNTYSRFLLKK